MFFSVSFFYGGSERLLCVVVWRWLWGMCGLKEEPTRRRDKKSSTFGHTSFLNVQTSATISLALPSLASGVFAIFSPPAYLPRSPVHLQRIFKNRRLSDINNLYRKNLLE